MREIGENIVSSRSGATPRPLTKTRGPAASANGPSRYDSAPAQMTQVAAASASASEEPSRESRLRSSGRRASERQGPLSNAWATKLAAVVLALVTGTAMLWIGAPPAFASSPPTVTAVIASSGPTTGAQRVTVMGTNLASPTSVKFGATSATILSSTATTDTVTSPVGSIGTVDVTVTTSGGTSATSSADQYSYVEAPTAYVTGTNTVTPITIATNTPGTAITVGSGPYFIAITPDQAPTASFTVTPALAGAATSFDGSASGAPYGSITNYAWTFGDTATANTSTPTTTHTYATGGGYTATLTVTDSAGTSSTQVFTGQTVSNNGGVSAVASQSFTLPPTVSAVSPNAGPLGGGTVVTITGSGFVPGSTTVAFGAGAGTSVSCLATSCTATSPAESAGVVDVTVTTAGGTSATGSADHFTYDATPSVTAVSPAAGPITGATVVTITGTGFADAIATGGVTFAGTSATSYTINSDTSITATSPAHAAGVADVVVTNETGSSSTSSADHFSYEALPSVTAISPAAGTTNGGDVVTISGTGFVVGSTTVAFGASAGTSVTCASTTSCSATSPAGSAGVVDLTVTTAGGTSTISSADHFTYDATPSVTAVSPAAGPIAGGTVVTVTGSNFTGASVVDFGSNPATAYTVNSATQITATSPAGSASMVDITVTTPSGTSATSSADQYTYEGGPSLTALSPVAGPPSGGTTVTITGSNFTGASAVDFGPSPASAYTVNSATQITATSPTESASTVHVVITTPVGTSALGVADEFSFESVPTVTTVTPAAGPLTGGTSVTITGTAFTGVTGVDFGSVPATSYSVTSSTEIAATAPAGASGTADVEVTNSAGTSATSRADQFNYESTPTISAVSPLVGPPSGGTSVTITGTEFTGATAVGFGSVSATSYVVDSATTMVVTSPPSSAGPVDVAVTNAVATSTASVSDEFTYELAPIVTALSPIAGLAGGGTSVTITGDNFTGTSAVDFGTTGASAYSVDGPTQITVTSPPAVASTVDITVTNPVGTSATSAADQFTYQLIPTLTAIATSPSASEVFGSSLTMTATVSAGATGSVDFEYSSDGTTYTAVPGCVPKTISGTTATCTTTSLPGGTEYLEAVYMGDASYATSTSAPSGFAVSAAAQTITFTSRPPAVPTVGGTYTLGATAPGGSVSFSLDAASSGCSLSGAIVTFTGVGTCVIDASSPAGNDYLAAAGKQSIVISQSPPGPGLGSITSVIASPGDRQALVSWSAPSNVSQFQNVSYTVTASPGGASCSSTGTLFCMVNGLSDSVRYTFTVTASSKDPTFSSITSPSSSPVTPTAAPLQTWATTTPELSPGSAEVVSSSGSMTKVAVKLSGDSVVAAGEGLKVAIATSATTGQGTHATVVLITGGTAWLKGSGFLGGSVIDFYVFSRGTLLGTAVAKSNGTCSATLRVPSGLVVGSHTIQVQGFATSHKRLAIAVGVIVLKSMKLSVVLAKFGVCDPGLKASMKTQLSKLAATIYAQGASSVVITGYTYSTGTWAKRLVHTQAVAAAEYLRASLQHLGYNRAVRIVIGVGRAASQALSRRVTMAVTLG